MCPPVVQEGNVKPIRVSAKVYWLRKAQIPILLDLISAQCHLLIYLYNDTCTKTRAIKMSVLCWYIYSSVTQHTWQVPAAATVSLSTNPSITHSTLNLERSRGCKKAGTGTNAAVVWSRGFTTLGNEGKAAAIQNPLSSTIQSLF